MIQMPTESTARRRSNASVKPRSRLPLPTAAGFLCVLLWVVCAFLPSTTAAASDEDDKGWCLDVGFNPDTLKCSTCAKLASLVTDEELVEECRKCCDDEGDVTDMKETYFSARLEVDPMLFQWMPQIRTFVDTKGKTLVEEGHLTIDFKHGMRPTLLLFAEGQKTPGETITVAQWSPDAIDDYIRESLRVNPNTQEEE